MDAEPVDVVVLGAGIAGCALGYHLARRGFQSIVVYDPQTPAAGATGRAAGILTEQLWDRWDVDVVRATQREYAELCARWQPDAYVVNGFVRFAVGPEASDAVDRARERLHGWGVKVEDATVADLDRWFPSGRFDDVRAASYGPHDACVTPSAVTTIYAEGARRLGVGFDFGQPLERIESDDNGRFLVGTAARQWRARQLVVAAGAWSKALLARLGKPLPLTPYRTQAALLRPARAPSPVFPSAHDIDRDVYLRPEANGRFLAGDGTEPFEADPDRFMTAGDADFLEHLGQSLLDRWPGWAESEVVGSWAGVCTSTPDRRPIVGQVEPGLELYVISGFNGFGVMRAGEVSRRLADLIADGKGSDPEAAGLGPVTPTRFPPGTPSELPRPGFTVEPGERPRY